MAPIPESQAPEETSRLEDRLRDLILNNARPAAEVEQTYPPLSPGYLPPHMLSASEKERAEYLKNQSLQNSASASLQPSQSARRGRKRLNQAQRRQMNAQNSIPVDTRPVLQGSYSSPLYSSSSGFHPPTHHYGQQGQVSAQPNPHGPHTGNIPFGHAYGPQILPHHQFHQSPTHMQQYSGHENYQAYSNANAPTPPIGYHQHASEPFRPQMPYNFSDRPPPKTTQLYQPGPYNSRGRGMPYEFTPEQVAAQIAYLEVLITTYVPKIAISDEEISLKEAFRASVETVCRAAIDRYERMELHIANFDQMSVELKCFGSMASGFATRASDMDLALFTPESDPAADSPESPIPRLIEKELLNLGYGARLLTRTRVPIIKLCQKPPGKLLSDLLREREKWENGFEAENEEDHEDTVEDKETDNGTATKLCDGRLEEDGDKSSAANYDRLLASLYQKPKQSLGDYYASAKRLLRKLGARDVGSAYSTALSANEVKTLVDVCNAFLNGLSDEALKNRLLTYESLSIPVHDQPGKLRSLIGIYTQMEGERLAMSWDRRPLRDSTDKAEADFTRQIQNWQNLLNRTDIESSAYGRMLHQAVEALKRIPSLQLLFLEQGLREDPIQYHARVSRIMNELSVKGKVVGTDNNDHVHTVVVAHYIAGIGKPNIRSALQTMADQGQVISLNSLLVKHRILELADDYEIALSKNVYDEVDRHEIEQYIGHLRNGTFDPTTQPSSPGTAGSVVANDSVKSLIEKVRRLPDPSVIARKVRDRYKDHLEFPKSDVGVQCDINFSAHLGIHNTQLLRCYSLTDARVKPLVLFIKFWAKTRGINTPYRGTLSSYGYVLMVLHYLTNIVTPFVCPNLQVLRLKPPPDLPTAEIARQTTCNGYDVAFWRNEKEIARLSDSGELNHNHDPLGKLLRGFFEYFANSGPLSSGVRGFDWSRDVLSLRTPGGLLSKQEKGWIGARTVMETTNQVAPAPSSASAVAALSGKDETLSTTQSTASRKPVVKQETKEIKYRFLFAIEDPFEIDHNVARTVTHDGIVTIRDELRRAWQIIKKVGTPREGKEGLLDSLVSQDSSKDGFQELMDLLHGNVEIEAQAEIETQPAMHAA